MDIIELINNEALKSKLDTPIEELDISIRAYNRLRRANIKTVLDIMQIKSMKDIENLDKKSTDELYMQLLKYGIDFNDKEQCKKLIDEYNNQEIEQKNTKTAESEPIPDNNEKNTNIIELMETPIEQIQLSTKPLTTRLISSIDRVFYFRKDYCFRDIIFFGKKLKKIKNIGSKCYDELKQKFNEYGIDIENEEQCKKFMHQYTEQKEKQIIDTVKILDTSLEDIISSRIYNYLKNNGYNNLYDIILEKKEKLKSLLSTDWNYMILSFGFIKYGIDINNEKQCEELIQKYNMEKETNQKIDSEIEPLELKVNENNSLENERTQKQKVLKNLKIELERKEKLEKKIAQCEETINELIKQYNSLNSKESSNNHGTK